MSCVEQWKEQNFPHNWDICGSVMQENVGVIKIPIIEVIKIPRIEYINAVPRRLRIRVTMSLGYSGYLMKQYICNCSFGLARVIVLSRSPLQKLMESISTIVNLNILFSVIQLISTISTIF
ncbi:MAG: hypothetical protein QXO72_05150 [Sulfolobales archaeon]